MKKIIALLLALTTVAGMAVTAVAQTGENEVRPEIVATDAAVKSAQMVLGQDRNAVVLDENTVLTPGETYYFPLRYQAQDGTESALTKSQFQNLKFRWIGEENTAYVKSIQVKKYRSDYCLVIETRVKNDHDLQPVEFSVTVVDASDKNHAVAMQNLRFQTGFPELPDRALNNPAYVEVNPKTPVITKEQFAELNDLAEGGEVTFGYGDWEYAVKVRGMKTLNLKSSEEEIDAVVEAFPNQEFKFVSFQMGPAFRTTGTLTIDVSGESNEFDGSYYVYMYDNGRLIGMNSAFDEERETLTVKTAQLGRFVITNKALRDGKI